MKAFLRLLSSSLSRLLFGLVSLLPCLSCAGGEFDISNSKYVLVLKGGDSRGGGGGHLPMSYNMIIMTL